VCHDASADLIRAVNRAHLQLLSPVGQITWARGLSRSTLDLAFGSPMVLNRLTKCQVNTDLDHRSDHLPVGIALALEA
jgi:hypothetical protein